MSKSVATTERPTDKRPEELLWPKPQEVVVGEGHVRLTLGTSIQAPTGDAFSVMQQRILTALEANEVEDVGDGAGIHLRLDGSAVNHPEGYRLVIDAEKITVSAASNAGVRHGVATLVQWIHLNAEKVTGGGLELPTLSVEDWPDFPNRGVLLDVSRDKVPTMETLYALVDRLADWKMNQLQLYVEHTFAYERHKQVWCDSSPLTGEEMKTLDRYCTDRGIELVPNQNSFGHFHRWLAHESYRHLAECPDGIEHPFNDRREPFSLAPEEPGTIELLVELYDELLPNFASKQLNVGLDETFDLGKGRSRVACEARGQARVYLDFLNQVHSLVRQRGHRMQFWGDIIIDHPELIPELPRDCIPLEWGYEADHPFAEHAAAFAASNLDFYVCPGTSGWNSLGGRLPNAIDNLANAARHGIANGAIGYLITDWGDFGHMQPLSVSYPGLLAGSGFSWNVRSADEAPDFAELLDRHVLACSTGSLGSAIANLGSAYTFTNTPNRNGTELFRLLIFPAQTLEHGRYDRLTVEGLDAADAHLERTATGLAGVTPVGPESELVVRELAWVSDMLRFACRFGSARVRAGRAAAVADIPPDKRSELAGSLEPLIGRQREIWLARNRAGGLNDSIARLTNLLALLTE